MRCQQCKHFIKTYEGEGWCSQPKYSGIVIFSTNVENCRGNGYVRGTESPPSPPSAPEENQYTP